MVALVHAHQDRHDAALRGAWPAIPAAEPGPTLVERTDEDFLPAFLEELKSANPGVAVAAARPRPPSDGKALRLYQPVHRVFNLVVLEAHCRAFGEPRLDPRNIESAGLVVRRIALDRSTGEAKRDGQGRTIFEGWLANKSMVTGWRELTPGRAADEDPDPARRQAMRLTADISFDVGFLGGPPTVVEETTSLFVAPLETAASTGRTLIYGVVPLTSSSRSGEPAGGPEPSKGVWQAHLSLLLKPATSYTLGVPQFGSFVVGDLETYGGTQFITLFRQLAQEFRLFDAGRGERARQVIAELNGLTISLTDDSTSPLGSYLESVARVLRDDDSDVPAVPRPRSWPSITSEQSERLYDLLRAVADEVRQATIAPIAGRYDDSTRQYAVRAFLRLKMPPACPPQIVWTSYSEPFEIAPWFEPGPVGPVHVTLPDPFDRNFLKKAKAGVAFSVPSKLANFLNQDPKEMLKGNATPGGGPALDWMCGFNIPIITICAFIVLSVFLSLFDLVFHWLMFVKICIPFPRKK